MAKKKRKIPWPVNEYFVNEETKTIYLRGSWSRAMMLNFENRRTQLVSGYVIKLCSQKYLHDLKVNHYDNTQKD